MRTFEKNEIRNICLIGKNKSGKTSLAEALIYNTGISSRLGKVDEGNTICDFDAEEIKRKMSVRLSIASFEYNNHKVNLIDAPGYYDFIADRISSMELGDSGLVVISGKSGIGASGAVAVKKAQEKNLPLMFFVNKMDHENADFDKVVAELKERFGGAAVPVMIPIRENGNLIGYIDVANSVAYKYGPDGKNTEIPVPEDMYAGLQNTKAELCEAIAEADETLLEKFFSDSPFTKEDMKMGIAKAIEAKTLIPIACGSALLNVGIKTLLNLLLEYMPAARGDENAPFKAQVLKTVVDPYVGKLTIMKIHSGILKANTTVYNANKEETEKIGQLIVLCGKDKSEIPFAAAGDICATAKLDVTGTGDTLCTEKNKDILPVLQFPVPNYLLAVVPKARGDEEKISSGLAKLAEEDMTFKSYINSETHQSVIAGMGDQQLDVIISRLKGMGTEVTTVEPKVSYRETITRKITAEGKHKKQSGGHGQYGHVVIDFEPADSEGLVFEEQIFGGSVPKSFHPAVEKGLKEMMETGLQAGYRVVGIKAILKDGSYHDVDSSEMSFKMAAHIAFKELVNAGPVILEPIGHLEVSIPDEYTGDIMGDITKRRGRVIGMEPGKITAEVPVAQMHSYAIDLRAISRAQGEFTFDFERYEQAPANIAEKIIASNKE
ncbi:MAG: elongation factor G [Clostridia bacterium]|nr:elongation factor G [Clostridia bacterium]